MESENFEALRKLLTLKKHELPPPGFFDQFSRELRSRLAAGEHRQSSVWRELGDEASWLQRLWAAFAEKPALAGAFGVAVCALMLSGIYLAQKPEPVADAAVAATWKLPLAGDALQPGVVATTFSPLTVASTNPVPAVPVGGSLFDRPGGSLQAVPVGFQPGGQ